MIFFIFFIFTIFVFRVIATNCTSTGTSEVELITDSSTDSTELFVYTTAEIAPIILDVASVPVIISNIQPVILSSSEEIQIISTIQVSGSVIFQTDSRINFVGSLGRQDDLANQIQIDGGSLEIQPNTVISLDFFSEEEKNLDSGIPIIIGTNGAEINGVENLILENDDWEIQYGTGEDSNPTVSVLFVGSEMEKKDKSSNFAKYLYIVLPSVLGVVCVFTIFLLIFLVFLKKSGIGTGVFFSSDKESKGIAESISHRVKKHGVVLGNNESQRHYSVNLQPGRASGSK